MKATYFLFWILIFSACQNQVKETPASNYFQITGKTMGTITYRIVYEDLDKRNLKPVVDSILTAFNNEVSVYVPSAVISRFNRNEIDFPRSEHPFIGYPHFKENIENALKICQDTEGAFDPTIMPIINYWGFGSAGKKPVEAIDSVKIDSFLNFIGYNKLDYVVGETGDFPIESLQKKDSRLEIDLGGLAKGYALDIVAAYFNSEHIQNYMIEIGLEVLAKGKNNEGDIWKIGINTPKKTAQITDIQEIIKLENTSIATSGNYRQFYEIDDQKLAHIIDPKTGFPKKSNLLSVSVIAEKCIIADAYATAFMVMGMEKALDFVEKRNDLEALCIYGKEDGTMAVAMSDGMKTMIIK